MVGSIEMCRHLMVVWTETVKCREIEVKGHGKPRKTLDEVTWAGLTVLNIQHEVAQDRIKFKFAVNPH